MFLTDRLKKSEGKISFFTPASASLMQACATILSAQVHQRNDQSQSFTLNVYINVEL